jgi:hypothetical protein
MDAPPVLNLPQAKTKTTLLGVSSADIPLQGASTSSTPTAGEGLGHIVSGVVGFRLAKKALSGSAKRKQKRKELGQARQELGAFSNQKL